MWHTSQGDRTLKGAEADLIQHLIESLLEDLLMQFDDQWRAEPDGVSETGVQLFDHLTSEQQIALLHDVAQHLLEPTSEGLALGAVAEATVAALYSELKNHLQMEMDLSPELNNHHWRSLTRKAAIECLVRDEFVDRAIPDGTMPDDTMSEIDLAKEESEAVEFRVPPVESMDMEAWDLLVESLADQILWDRDFEMAASFLDEDPERSASRREVMGIDSNYFVQIAPDPRPDEVSSLVSATQALIRRKPR